MTNNKKLISLIIAGIALIGSAIALKAGNIGTSALWNISGGGEWMLPLVIVAALIDGINPCAFSVLILSIAFLYSVGKLRSSVIKIGSVYIFGIFSAYILIGLGILQAFHLFNTPRFMGKAGAILLITLGIIGIINELFPKFPVKLKIPKFAHHKMAELMEKTSLPSAFLLGVLVGLCEFPCTGGPYLMILGLLHDQGTYVLGLGYLVLYNLIFISPLVIILLISGNKKLVEQVQNWQKKDRKLMKFGGSVAMILLGMLILFI